MPVGVASKRLLHKTLREQKKHKASVRKDDCAGPHADGAGLLGEPRQPPAEYVADCASKHQEARECGAREYNERYCEPGDEGPRLGARRHERQEDLALDAAPSEQL